MAAKKAKKKRKVAKAARPRRMAKSAKRSKSKRKATKRKSTRKTKKKSPVRKATAKKARKGARRVRKAALPTIEQLAPSGMPEFVTNLDEEQAGPG